MKKYKKKWDDAIISSEWQNEVSSVAFAIKTELKFLFLPVKTCTGAGANGIWFPAGTKDFHSV